MTQDSEHTHHNIDYDLADFNKLSTPVCNEGLAFNTFMKNMINRLTKSSESPLQKYNLTFCLQNRNDSSVARISSAQYRMDATDLSGNDFIVMFNREKLSHINTEDELAFILAHELSHLEWQHNNESVKNLSHDEEVACDMNAVKMLKNGGYALSIVNQMDTEAPKTAQWQQRKEARRQICLEYFDFTSPTELDQSAWQNQTYTPLKPNFKLPSADDSEDKAVNLMLQNLKTVYRQGGAENFQDNLKNYLHSVPSEKASSFFLKLSAAATKEFPPIDEDSRNKDYRQKQRHPINVLGNAIPSLSSLNGKKLYPPEACSTLNSYFKQNPNYHKTMKIFWDKALLNDSPIYHKQNFRN